MAAALFFLIGWYSVDHTYLPLRSAISIAKDTAKVLGLFGSLFVAILGVVGFVREFQPTYDFIWARRFSTYDYIVGKYIGVCAGVGTALLPVCAWVTYLEGTLHGFQGMVVQAKVWAVILAPTLVSALAITLLLGLLLKRALWTSLVIVFIIVGVLALNLNVTHLEGFAPYGIYVSPLIGYGPDSRIVGLHRAFYLELTALILLFALMATRFTAPRLEKKLNLLRKVGWGLLATGLLIGIFYTVIYFRDESDILSKGSAFSPSTGETQDCSLIHSYRAELVLHHETARLEGKAHIQLQPTTTSIQLPLDLNAGLQISKVQATLQGIEAEVTRGTLVLALPQELRGQDVSLTLAYSGYLHIPKRLYDNLFRSHAELIEPFWVGGYLDGETAFLTRDGNWHPLPECVPDYLRVELLGAPSQIVHTADKAESSSGGVTLIWEQQPPLPLFAASQNYHTIQVREATVLIAPRSIPENELDVVLFPYPVVMSQIETYLQEGKLSDSRTSQIAVMPLLKYGKYDTSSGVLLLPIPLRDYKYLLDKITLSSSPRPLNSPELLYHRWTAEKMMRLWWCSNDICPPLQVRGRRINYVGDPDLLEYNRKVSLNALLTYAALRLAEPLVGQEFVAAEIAARQRQIMLLEDGNLRTRLDLPLSIPEIHRLMIQLHSLWERTGSEPFWRLVREYHQLYGNTSPTEEEFGQFVRQITGEPLH